MAAMVHLKPFVLLAMCSYALHAPTLLSVIPLPSLIVRARHAKFLFVWRRLTMTAGMMAVAAGVAAVATVAAARPQQTL